ncbi:MAG: bifunctional 4-hydroxy-2-oxoglutarate aldolase/2-dehydro-3-deoxy-phosphogluconate aldolase, partial [Caulobacterales bacterium]
MLSIDDIMNIGPVIAVLEVQREEDAMPLAAALLRGGVKVIEVTLRTPASLGVIREMSKVGDAIVGAGTVLNAALLGAAREAGAQFIVSPGLSEHVAEAAFSAGVPHLPGIATASEIMKGLELGLTRFKFFPAETSGGVAAVAAFAGPFKDVRFCPTGGVSSDNAQKYLHLPKVLCVGGSWLATKEDVADEDWQRIENV